MKNTLIKPMRVQRLRKKGFNLQEASRSGLPVKYVGRPTKWGNPFRLTPDGFIQCYSANRKILDPWIMWSYSSGFEIKDIVELYGRWLDGELKAIAPYLPTPPSIEELKGKDLACFCSLSSPCHVDAILERVGSIVPNDLAVWLVKPCHYCQIEKQI